MTELPSIKAVLRKGATGHEVVTLQFLLRGAGINTAIDGSFGPGTERSVRAYQVANKLDNDGVVGSGTVGVLLKTYNNPKFLKLADFTKAATRTKSDLAAVLAVTEVESLGTGFLEDGRPKILFERHIMRRQLLERNINPAPYMSSNPDLVSATAGGYVGAGGEYARLARAIGINPDAARASCSWGMYQVMGYHAVALGYTSLDAFVTAMRNSERDHLESFCRYVEWDAATAKALAKRDWTAFAKAYNGPASVGYDTKLKAAYERLTRVLKDYPGV